MGRDLSERDYVYVWADGVHTSVRLGSDGRLCSLVVLGARLDGTKELVAMEDGRRESEESWACLPRSLKKRGMRAPEAARGLGDGALGFWAALRGVFPETRVQKDWVHKARNVLDSMPKSVHRRAKAAMREITCAEGKEAAGKAVEAFASEFGVKWPKAAAKITTERETLLAFYDYPAEHWVHLRTSNPIESVFAPVRARTDVTKGPGSRAAGLAMIFKLTGPRRGGGGDSTGIISSLW